MPKDEFDFDDPMELNGMAFTTEEDTTDAMCECFIEEFMRMGYDATRILALFRNPHYIGMNMVLQNRGETYVTDFIAEVFARWGRRADFGSTRIPRPANNVSPGDMHNENPPQDTRAPHTIALDHLACDPMGAALPKLNH